MKIAIAGKSKSGKTTAAKYLKKKYGGEILSFATPLKVEVFSALEDHDFEDFYEFCDISLWPLPKPPSGLDQSQALSWIDENKNELREMLQLWGDFKRHSDPDYFVTRLIKTIDSRGGGQFLFIDDLRLRNEVLALEARDFQIIRVQAGDKERQDRGANLSTHESETELDNYHFKHIVFNDGLPHELYAQLDKIVKAN